MHERRFNVALDNHEPTRRTVMGILVETRNQFGAITIDDPESLGLRDAERAIYLLDDGATVFVYYVAGVVRFTDFRQVVLHPFPLSGGVRPDNGRPVDMSAWMLGPRRAYHLKLA